MNISKWVYIVGISSLSGYGFYSLYEQFDRWNGLETFWINFIAGIIIGLTILYTLNKIIKFASRDK